MPENIFQLRYSKGEGRFPLNQVASNNNIPLLNDTNNSFRKRFGQFSKNTVKSTVHLTVDVLGKYLPNIKSIGEAIDESQREVKDTINKKYNRIVQTVNKIVNGDDNKDPKQYLENLVSASYGDAISRLKTGKFYKSSKDKKKEAENMVFDGFDTEFDSFEFPRDPDPETVLSNEPFGAPLTNVTHDTSNENRKNSRRRIPKSTIVAIQNDSNAPQLTLGDKLNSDTVQYSATALINSHESVFNKQFATDELRHTTLIKYQDSILNGVNAVVDHLQNVEGRGTADLIEISQKTLALQENSIGVLKELQRSVIVTSSSYEEEITKGRSKASDILNGGNGFNKNAFFKNIKSNIMDVAYASPAGSLLGITPLLGSLLGMPNTIGLGKKPKIDILSGLLRSGANSLLSKQTRGRLAGLNEIAGGLGPLFIGQMNKMARFSDNPVFKTMGQIFGIKQSRAERLNLGVENLDAKVNWTAKSERTLNEVIPNYLSKITAALTGTEETSYDYKTGQFRKNSSVANEFKRVKESAWYDATIDNISERFATEGLQDSKVSKLIKEKNISKSDLKRDIDIIMKNISKSAISYSPEKITDVEYREQLTNGIPEEQKIEALYLFDEMYNNLDSETRLLLNVRTYERGVRAENTLLDFNKNIIKTGGSAALQNAIAQEEIQKIEEELKYSPHLQIEGLDEKSFLYGQRKKKRAEALSKIDTLKSSGTGQVNAVRLNDDMTASFSGGGGISDTSQDVSSSMIGMINNIYALLSQGILVYPQNLKNGSLPKHISKIFKANKQRINDRKKSQIDKEESVKRNEELIELDKELSQYKLSQHYIKEYATLGDIFNNVSGLNNIKTFGPLSQMGNAVAEGGIQIADRLFGGVTNTGKTEPTQSESEFERLTSNRRPRAATANVVDPIKEGYESVLNTLSKNMEKSGVLGHISKKLYPIIDNKNKKERKYGIDPKTGFKKKLNDNGEEKQNKIINAVERAYGDFYNKYIIKNEFGQQENMSRGDFLLTLYRELKQEGIDDTEINNISSQIIEEPIGDNKAAIANTDIDINEISKATMAPKEILTNTFVPKTKKSKLPDASSLFEKIKANKAIKPPSAKKDVTKNIKDNLIEESSPNAEEFQTSDENISPVPLENMRDTPRSIISSVKDRLFPNIKETLTIDEHINPESSEKIQDKLGGIVTKPINTIHDTGKKALFSMKDKLTDSFIIGKSAINDSISNIKNIYEENIPKANIITSPEDAVNDKREQSQDSETGVNIIKHETSKIQGMLDGFFERIKPLFNSEKETVKEDAVNKLSSTLFPGAELKIKEINNKIKTKLKSIINPDPEKIDEASQEHQFVTITYNILEETIQQLVKNSQKEPTFEDIKKAVDEKIREGKIDADIAYEVMKRAHSIANDKDKNTNPINAYFSSIYALKESYNKKYRKDNSFIRKIIKNIAKGGIKPIAATTLLVTGHPIMAAMLAFGPKNTFKGAKAGIKGAIKGSKFLAELSGKALGIAARASPGVIKTGFGVIGKILGGDIFGERPKKSREDINKEKEIAALTFKSLETILRQIMEENPNATINDIKKVIKEKVNGGVFDKEIADAVIQATEQNMHNKDAAASPLNAFLQAILTLKKKYSKEFKKNLSVPRKIASVILKGAGKGIGAAALLMSGHPILAASLALSGPVKLFKSLKKDSNQIKNKVDGSSTKGIFGKRRHLIDENKEKSLEQSKEAITEEQKETKEGLFSQFKKIASNAKTGSEITLDKAKGVVSGAFGDLRGKVSGLFNQERREGSLFDKKEDKKEERQAEIQEKTLGVLEEIRDNTHDTEEELDKKEERQSSFFKKLGIGGGAVAGGAGLAGLFGSLLGNGTGGIGGLADAANKGIGTVLKKGISSIAGKFAGKSGILGKIGGTASKLLGTGAKVAGSTSAGAATKGINSVVGGIAGKASGIGSKAANLLAKAGGIGGKATGLLGKAGGIAKLAGPALGGIAKFAGPLGIALTAAQAVGGGLKGWKNASSVAGLEEGKEATTGQKIGSAASGALSALTLGLIKPQQMYGAGKAIGNTFKSAFGKEQPELDEEGKPKLDENGDPIMKKRGLASNILRWTPAGLAIRAVQSGLDKDKRKERRETLKMGILKAKDTVTDAFGKEQPELDEEGKPKLDENGDPIMKKRGLASNILRYSVPGLLFRGIKNIVTDKKEKDDTLDNADDEKTEETALDKVNGTTVKKKSSRELLLNISEVLTKGIIVFPSELSEENAPEYLKTIAKKGASKSFSLGNVNQPNIDSKGRSGPKSLFDKGKETVSNAWQTVKDFSGNVKDSIVDFGSSLKEKVSEGLDNAGSILKNLFKGPKEAASLFYDKPKQFEKQITSMINAGQYQEIEELGDTIKDPSSMGQNKSVDSLSPKFGNRVKAFINSPEAQAKGVTIREARRSPLTQLAYFTKGRASDESFIHRMFKKAGFPGGAWSPDVQNTKTLGSEHFQGNAVDFNDHGKGVSYYKEIAPIAKKYGLEWGGDWPDWKDYPHFQLPKNDKAIGYKGPPKSIEEGNSQSNNSKEKAAERADGEGFRYYNQNAKVTALSTNRNITTNSTKRKQPDTMGTTTATTLHLKESPIVTSDKILIDQINNAINIQNAIYTEQKRHNNVSENFFTALMALLQEMNKTNSMKNNTHSNGNNNKINMNDLQTMTSIMEAEKIARDYFVNNARKMAQGI
jgi:hypothetical protein